MIGGLSRLAAQPEGSLALFETLEDEEEDKGFFSSMGSILTSPLALAAGGMIVNRMFGSKKGPIEAGLSAAQLAVLWVKEQPGITAPIIGPRKLEQLEHLLPLLEMSLPDEVRAACDALVPPGSAAVNFHNTAPWMKGGAS